MQKRCALIESHGCLFMTQTLVDARALKSYMMLLLQFQVETISQRMSQLEASTSKRVNRGEIFSRSAQMRQVTDDSGGFLGGVRQAGKSIISIGGPGVPLGIGVMDVASQEESGGGYTSERVAAHFHRKGISVPGGLPLGNVQGSSGGDLALGEESSRLVRSLLGGGAAGVGAGSLAVDMAMG